ncbi:MAG: hypothetical protein AAGA48_13155 [Myxococcota bacterium]
MGDILVKRGSVVDGKIEELVVQFHGLAERTIDRDTALKWMRDGHSLIPTVNGKRLTALQLVDLGDESYAIRHDNASEPEDDLPPLPGAAS